MNRKARRAKMFAMDKASARVHDINGWFEVKGNPLSKVGIFEYSGAQVGAPPEDADRIFKVYRPAEELGSAETIDSFKLVPFIDDHTMLGEGFESAASDDVPVSGVIGEDVYFEGDTLYGNPKVFSKALAEKIKNNKIELSCGYRCRYEFTSGSWDGKAYDVIQRQIRGNHLALVDEGRMGPEVSILDQMTFAVDAMERPTMDEELKKTLDAIKASNDAIMARLDALEGAGKAKDGEDPKVEDDGTKAKDGDDPKAEDTDEPKAEDDDEPKAEDEDDLAEDIREAASGADAKLKKKLLGIADRVKSRPAARSTPKPRPAMDERAIVDMHARRVSLAERLSAVVGTFDHSRMTAAEIAKYGVTKLGIKNVVSGNEELALDAYLQGRPVSTPARFAQDAAPTPLASRLAQFGASE